MKELQQSEVKKDNDFNEYQILSEQIKLLAAWNKEYICDEPEQARKNIETICDVLTKQKNI